MTNSFKPSNKFACMCLTKILSGDTFPFLIERFIHDRFEIINVTNKKLCPTICEVIYKTSQQNIGTDIISRYYSKYAAFIFIRSEHTHERFVTFINDIYPKDILICQKGAASLWESILLR